LVFATDEVTRTTRVIGQGKILFAHVRFVFLNLKGSSRISNCASVRTGCKVMIRLLRTSVIMDGILAE